MRYEFTHFVPENVAPKGATRIVVKDSNGNTVATTPLGRLALPADIGDKPLYSFGALADVHVQLTTARDKFQKALSYFNDVEKVAFTCIAGDLTDNGETADFVQYRDYVTAYSPNTPVYATTGNHDVQTSLATIDSLKPYTGNDLDLYDSFTYGDDVFIFFGMQSWYTYIHEPLFSDDSLQWLYDTLEANRNKRCFVFEHCPRSDGCGWPPASKPPTGDLLHTNGDQPLVFRNLMAHYKNAVWFHGHSHMNFNCQYKYVPANYDRLHGCHSVHVPSLACGRVLNEAGTGYTNIDADSEGYVVDVYKNHVVLRGRDFANDEFFAIAQYCLDTTLQTIAAKTFTGGRGIITI